EQPASGLAAFFHEVRTDQREVQRRVGDFDRSVGEDHGDVRGLGSRNTVSQPVSTTGEKAMTSTRWAMNERSALIWFSCFCWASAKRSVMPASLAADWMDRLLAVRHSLSAPIWLNPITMGRCPG